MKLRNLILGALAGIGLFASCQEEVNLGTPKITISTSELEQFDIDGGSATLQVTASRDWMVDTPVDWVVVDPDNGEASADPQTVTVTVLPNTDTKATDREADVKFTIGMMSKTLKVSQKGPAGSAEALIRYMNDYDKEEAEKTYGSGSSWPFLDQFEGWKNHKGEGAAAVTYSFNGMSARANSTSSSDYSDYDGSGKNNMFFGSNAYLATKNISLGGNTKFELSFGTEKYSQDNGSAFKKSEFHIFLSNDGSKWVELTDYTFAGDGTEGRWNVATAYFSVPEGTENLSICMQVDVASSYRMDDLKLVVTENECTAVDFTSAVEKDFNAGGSSSGGGSGSDDAEKPATLTKATISEFLAAAEDDTWYELTGKIIEIQKQDYGNFVIEDATGEVLIYGMTNGWVGYNDKSFAQIGLKVGDTVTLGSRRGSYNGNPQGGGNKVPAYYISHVAGEGGSDSGSETPEQPANLTKVTISEFLAAAEDDTWYELTGEIISIESGNAYGNFTIKDETGEVYIYGMTSKWVGTNDKSFASLGLKETDIVTLGTLRTSYQGTPQGGGNKIPAFYISHVSGEGVPENPDGTVVLTFPADNQDSVNSYTSEWNANVGEMTWKIINFNNNKNGWSYIKCGHKSTSNVATISTTKNIQSKISKVIVQVDKLLDATKVKSAILEVSSDAGFENVLETVEVTIAKGALEYVLTTPVENAYYRLSYDCEGLGGDTNGNVQISKVTYLAAE